METEVHTTTLLITHTYPLEPYPTPAGLLEYNAKKGKKKGCQKNRAEEDPTTAQTPPGSAHLNKQDAGRVIMGGGGRKLTKTPFFKEKMEILAS